jgi:hypothetical protein
MILNKKTSLLLPEDIGQPHAISSEIAPAMRKGATFLNSSGDLKFELKMEETTEKS